MSELTPRQQNIAGAVAQIIRQIGENPERDGLLKTPERVAKAYEFLTDGYHQDGEAVLKSAMFDEDYSEMVLVRDIEMYSLCEHHMLPFFGHVHIAYIPNGKIVGLSKLPRLVDVFARRLQVQERLTIEIRDSIQYTLHPHGVAVVLEAKPVCLPLPGVSQSPIHI